MARPNATMPGKKIDLSRKKLKELPWNVSQEGDEDIWILDLQQNKLKSAVGIPIFLNLRELNLSRNDFVEFPLQIKELCYLEKLYLNQNSIRSIPCGVFSQLQKLQFLKLSTNRLVDLPSDVADCKSLTYVNLSNNVLKDLKALEGLSKLEELYVENNHLRELSEKLFLNTDLRKFKAAGNQLRSPPEEVCAGGVKTIQRYFKMLGNGFLTVHRVKTMFLGSSMAGKSTLCRSLKLGCSVEVDVTDRTEGIEISEVEKEGVRFLFWDFAGHEEYYFTHHVFITPQAFVILAIDLHSYNIKDPQSFLERVRFWVRNVQLRVPDSVVLLVGTHVDQCNDAAEVNVKKEDIERRVKHMLKEWKHILEVRKEIILQHDDATFFKDQLDELEQLSKYNLKVLDLIPIDCTKVEDIWKLQAHILQQVQNKEIFPSIERTLPGSYQEVESVIQKLLEDEDIPQHGIVSLDELLNDINSRLRNLDHEDLRCILRYLHLIGIVVWYEEVDTLADTVFVKPSFLITLFKAIVRHDLEKQLEDIPRDLLQKEICLVKHKRNWLNDLKDKGTLENAAIRVLARIALKKMDLDKEDFLKEVVGSRKENGKLLSLLQHFEVCLPTKLSNPLNPEAQEFIPNGRRWEPSDYSQSLSQGSCLFPSYLKDNHRVHKMWGEDKGSDIRVNVYFLPEIPYGFFHRLAIKTCSFYPTNWAGKDNCLVCSNHKLVLFKEKCLNEDHLIEIRCRMPENNEIQQHWDIIQTVLSKLEQLTRQWPGLCQYVSSPCLEKGCSADFEWNDCRLHDEKVTCSNGHSCRSEFMFPKVLRET